MSSLLAHISVSASVVLSNSDLLEHFDARRKPFRMRTFEIIDLAYKKICVF